MSIVPIRPDVTPETDAVRDLISFAAENISAFAESDEPVSVALVVLGKAKAGAISWSVVPDKSVGEVCAFAAALLMNRATQS